MITPQEEEGLDPEEAALVIQRYWGRKKKAKQKLGAPSKGAPTPSKRSVTPLSTKMSDLIMFSEQVGFAISLGESRLKL